MPVQQCISSSQCAHTGSQVLCMRAHAEHGNSGNKYTLDPCFKTADQNCAHAHPSLQSSPSLIAVRIICVHAFYKVVH